MCAGFISRQARLVKVARKSLLKEVSEGLNDQQ